ncbi:MAG: hypothetical protein QOD03_889 [Verrucomicrobiota bacterium]|jgi:hypothetical protein
MAKLLVISTGLENRLIELKLGLNRVGRSSENDFQIVHPTISNAHCEFILADGSVMLRDLDSTNGTFVNDQPVGEIQLVAGQTVRLGDVELFVETTDVTIAIPKFSNPELPAPPVVKKNGKLVCPRHSHAQVTHKCTHCNEVMCEACVHQLRRKGSHNLLMLCPICSHAVEPIGGPVRPKKKSLISRVTETVKLKLTGIIRR